MNITFGKKIPIATCVIQNKKTKEHLKATIFEHDAHDSEDVQYFKNLPKGWKYGEEVAENIGMKHEYPYTFEDDRYFSLENKKGEPIGIMQISDNTDFINIEYLEAHNRRKFGLIGTNLLAMAAIETLKEGQERLIITDPVKKAKPFYIEHCGFKPNQDILEMKRQEMKIFKSKCESKTKILDIRG